MRNFRREVAAASESPVELPETEFSWSLTRHLRFLHCERGYFLHYYAAQGGWDRYADSVAAAVYRGKKTLLLPEWLEERMDQAWKSVLDRIRFLPEKMRQRAFRYRLERRLLEDLEEEAEKMASHAPDYLPFPDFPLPAEDFFRKGRHDCSEALNFCFSTQIPQSVIHFQRPNRINENLCYESYFDGVRIWSNPGVFWSEPGMRCSMRFSFRPAEKAILQAGADLFAWHIRESVHESAATSFFFVPENGHWECLEFSGDPDRAEELMGESITWMRSRIRPGNVVCAADFPECGIPEVCQSCRFNLACSLVREL